MKKLNNILISGSPQKLPVSRPTMATLVFRIAESALSGSMLWIMFFGGLLIAFLHVNHLPAEHLLVLMIFAVMLMILLRGIGAWEDDLDEYQRNLSEYRMNMADNQNKPQVSKDIIWDRH